MNKKKKRTVVFPFERLIKMPSIYKQMQMLLLHNMVVWAKSKQNIASVMRGGYGFLKLQFIVTSKPIPPYNDQNP